MDPLAPLELRQRAALAMVVAADADASAEFELSLCAVNGRDVAGMTYEQVGLLRVAKVVRVVRVA